MRACKIKLKKKMMKKIQKMIKNSKEKKYTNNSKIISKNYCDGYVKIFWFRDSKIYKSKHKPRSKRFSTLYSLSKSNHVEKIMYSLRRRLSIRKWKNRIRKENWIFWLEKNWLRKFPKLINWIKTKIQKKFSRRICKIKKRNLRSKIRKEKKSRRTSKNNRIGIVTIGKRT